MSLKRTAFFNIHKNLGAKLVDFAGFEMPVQYESIVKEHLAVRESVGVFDVSHMGEVEVSGDGAFEFLQNLTTNDISKLNPNGVQYSAMCNENGGIIDDLLVYNMNDKYMLVINASNIDKDLSWMREQADSNVTISDISDSTSLLAVQGRHSLNVLRKICGVDLSGLKYYTFTEGSIEGIPVLISRTGYTGEEIGFELYFSSDVDTSEKIWKVLFDAGSEFDIKPVGLGARDTLRLEFAYRLYGNDMDETTNPIEAGLGWITKLSKGNFIGSEAISAVKDRGISRKLVGFIIDGRLPARHGYEVYKDGIKTGYVTSGSLSPVLQKNIGLAYVSKDNSEIGGTIEINIRGKMASAEIVKTPFIN
ncbi:glycine cleavage system aminomethyltransferase GcvT [Ignavibacteria bacterium CHB1]|nr:MAG: glycine cleavage system aminomethyltransferase GcvT [Chlorobiota bacterium]MBV6399224.1 Aminomethyltransferase [Ignavibacteria bacterium]MCC6884897.1 glycine cleavage system aminomethyltransferase GcvT [Ignavibacteriales bacterium]MCE7953572.1 glycine cleavage system aminomethyltransferase GcvT [Chlorobi bacterium CHB7]MDL1887538.1 glycine cleavage system aminomethyltransferase GcvT [Ignavibacteria bacterium CHB1]RIK49241.1 MAG: glycine cleavage system aminomethyltransferase GcvT [Igna